MSDNSFSKHYRTRAQGIVKRLTDNVSKTVKKGEVPDLYFDLETEIVRALEEAHNFGAQVEADRIQEIIKDFDEDDGGTNQ